MSQYREIVVEHSETTGIVAMCPLNDETNIFVGDFKKDGEKVLRQIEEWLATKCNTSRGGDSKFLMPNAQMWERFIGQWSPAHWYFDTLDVESYLYGMCAALELEPLPLSILESVVLPPYQDGNESEIVAARARLYRKFKQLEEFHDEFCRLVNKSVTQVQFDVTLAEIGGRASDN